MRMVTYIIRRLLLVVPTLLGVLTITFALFQALPVQYQLASHYGNPPKNHPCAFQSSCPCADDNHASVNARENTCKCYGSNVTVTPDTLCSDALYRTYIHRLGLDQPVWTQWGVFVYHAFTFQWGTVENDSFVATQFSWMRNVPVTTVIGWMLPYTLELAGLSLFFILIIAIPVGNLAAVNRNRPVDQAARILSFSGFAMPTFLLASFLLMGFVILIGSTSAVPYVTHSPWCPSGEATFSEFYGSWPAPLCFSSTGVLPSWLGAGVHTTPTGFPTLDAAINGQWWLAIDTLIRMILPALAIAFGAIAVLLRFVRNSMLEVMNLDFVRTARAEGIPSKTVVSRHAGRNSLNVTITVLGLTFAFFIGGFPVIEYVFHLNGVGLILAYSIQPSPGSVDFGLIFGTTLLFTFIIVIANIIVDILYAYLDPRVRLG